MRISDWSSDVCSSDLAYEAEWQEPLSVAYRAARFHVTPRLTAGPTIADAFTRLESGFTPGERPDRTAFAAYAAALKGAYVGRTANDGDGDGDGEHENPAPTGLNHHFPIFSGNGQIHLSTQHLLP